MSTCFTDPEKTNMTEYEPCSMFCYIEWANTCSFYYLGHKIVLGRNFKKLKGKASNWFAALWPWIGWAGVTQVLCDVRLQRAYLLNRHFRNLSFILQFWDLPLLNPRLLLLHARCLWSTLLCSRKRDEDSTSEMASALTRVFPSIRSDN